MDINKLTNSINGELKGTGTASRNQKMPETVSNNELSDKVSLKSTDLNKNEKQSARLELEKLHRSSFERINDYRNKLAEFEKAGNSSPESLQETEIGKKINDPAVWSEIADKILGF